MSLGVYVVEGDRGIARMFGAQEGYSLVDHPSMADIVVFPGGPDVDPSLYGEKPHPRTHYQPERDMFFLSVYKPLPPSVLKVGICGGGQFLNVVNGGRMWQHVDNHAIAGTHPVTYVNEHGEDTQWRCTSTHHQMMRPDGQYELWGTGGTRATIRDTGTEHNNPRVQGQGPDIEIVFYPENKSLCFQPHPEYGVEECRDLFFQCVERALRS